MKYARRTFKEPYACQYEWDEDCFVQCGGNGIVLKGGLEKTLTSTSLADASKNIEEHLSYRTAFFEAFPNNPSTFIRGEGATIEEAETKAWNFFQKISKCDHPDFDRRKYTNGAGFCTECGMFKSKAFEPLTRCIVCDTPTYNSNDINGDWYCEAHPIPQELKQPWMIEFEQEIKEAEERDETNKRAVST